MNSKQLALLVGVCAIARMDRADAQPNAPGFTSVELEPTVAYLNQAGGARRMARLVFHGGKSYGAGSVEIAFNGLRDRVDIPASAAGLAAYELALPGPPVALDTQLEVTYRSGRAVYTARCVVAPARTWSVYVLPHSHVDVGYTNVQDKVLAIHENNIDEAIQIARRTESYPREARFKWNTEAMWVVDNYLARATDDKKRAFWDAVQRGWINLDAAYGNVNTSVTSPAQLLAMFATGLRLAKAHGIELQTMFQGDVPGSSWGLAAQAEITGVKYFLSAPNASDRIGTADRWRDRPFYWISPSGGQRLLFWQSSPYSIGYALKGSKLPNFFTVEDPKPYYTGAPSDNFLNPYLFGYLAGLEQKGFPYQMTLLTWAMSDNAPIDPELPEAVKAWNERFASPRLIITSVKQFFGDFEAAYKDKIPAVSGDYTEYWTDGIGSAARETGLNRNAADRLQQAGAIWALNGKAGYPTAGFDEAWTQTVMFGEHTWGAYNSVSHPEDPKAIAQWSYKQAFALHAASQSEALLAAGAAGDAAVAGAVDVYNTLSVPHGGLVVVPAAQSRAGDRVRDARGQMVVSQRLRTGELAFLVPSLPPFAKRRFTIQPGRPGAVRAVATAKGNRLQTAYYTVDLDPRTGNIVRLTRAGDRRNLADGPGLNQYAYLPDDALDKLQVAGPATITVKEPGPLVASLVVTSPAPGASRLTREVRVVTGLDRVELIDTIDKTSVTHKESVHFVFPFRVPGGQVRYQIPWGSVTAEADQLKDANRNWYTVQRWVDVSNPEFGVTWSSPDAPLFEIGPCTTAGMLGSLEDPASWLHFTEQQATISSWVMNNLWHTNFRRDQEGPAVFRYALQAHGAYDPQAANRFGLESHQPLVVAPAAGPAEAQLFFQIAAKAAYVEAIAPARNGKGVVLQLVNVEDAPARVTLSASDGSAALNVWATNLVEDYQQALGTAITIPGRGVVMLRVERK